VGRPVEETAAKYAKAYCNLQNHARNCALCAFVLEINVLTAAQKTTPIF
jgi:hypothetical protein